MRKRTVVSLLAAVLLLAVQARPALAGAFEDVSSSHWAYDYISVLDDEDVVDVYPELIVRWTGIKVLRMYRPARPIRRDAWFTFIARLFRLQPIHGGGWDGHRLESGEAAGPWIAAALAAGLVPGGAVLPEAHTQRQTAVASLVRALGLEAYAATLGSQDVDLLLARFRDRGEVDSALRPLLAAAVRLGIVEGYPDGTLRPRREMTRAEAAAVLARSALVRPDAAPNPFSPDGDGVDEALGITLGTLRNRNVRAWSAAILDPAQQVVWSSGNRPGGPPVDQPATWWDGRTAYGAPAPSGTYYLKAAIEDGKGLRWESTLLPVELVRHRLDATLAPSRVRPGDTVTITASTEGEAQAVTAFGPGTWRSEGLPLSPGGRTGRTQHWQATVRVPETAAEGPYALTVTARFAQAVRERQLLFVVEPELWLQGWVSPDPVPAGTRLWVYARTSANVTAVRALFADGEAVDLLRSGPDQWEAARTIPADAAPGPSWVDLVATAGERSRTHRVPFTVAASPLGQVQIVLTD